MTTLTAAQRRKEKRILSEKQISIENKNSTGKKQLTIGKTNENGKNICFPRAGLI